jgi:LTXXQ motif family protein
MRPVMRLWAISIVGVVAVSSAIPAPANARPRFGPGAVLGAVAGVMLGGIRPSFGHHRRSARGSADKSTAEEQRGDVQRTGDVVARTDPQPVAATQPVQPAAVFWPRASTDLVDYVFFPRGKDDRFWAYGFGAILDGVLAAPDGDASAPAKGPDQTAAAAVCGGGAADSADGLIERITQAIRPTEAQRETVEQLRSALTRAIGRIRSVCSGATAATPMDRLQAIQDRIWAMRDALLTLRLPVEKFYDSLSDEQHWRLSRDEGDARETTGTKIGGEQSCGEQGALTAEAPMRAIERAVRPTEPQRASLEAFRLRSAGMAQVIMSSCPTYPLLGHMGRFSAALDRLDGMLFTVMTLGPALQGFYDSLTDKQKMGLTAAIRQLRRSAAAGGS